MINSIISGMACAIYAEFGEEYTIYKEKISQGLTTPCFYLSCVDAAQNLFRGDVYKIEHRFLVLYFPSSEDANAECMDVADRLWTTLELIDTKQGKKMGTKMQAEIRDDLLNFSLTYSGYYRRDQQKSYMEHLEGRFKGV